MPLFLTTLREPSAYHRVEAVTEGFLILPNPGREREFDELAREVVNYVGPFTAFARRREDGLYDCVHILPEDYATSAEDRSFDHPTVK